MDLSYKEKLDKLEIRIRAHKEFANFDVAEWIDAFLGRAPRRAILDLGCGNGNHLDLYLKHVGPTGRVTGLDREGRLIDAARDAFRHAPNAELVLCSMDDPLPFPDGAFDVCFSNFAIYNASRPDATIRELHRVLKPRGQIALIGPTINNAREIYEYNERLTGVAIDEITLIRTDRLRREIAPIVQAVFGSCVEEVLNSYLQFPNADEFLLYFKSTMAYEETAEKRGMTDEQLRAAMPPGQLPIVSKEMLAIVATKA